MARQTADGKCVKTMVFTLPMRFAIEAAANMEMAEMMLVMKNRVPMLPSER